MKGYSSLLDAFHSLNERKREDPESLTDSEFEHWKEMRREIEKVLFQAEPDPTTDSRAFLRVPVSLAVRYWTRNELKDRYIPILGEGGLFVSTVDPLPIGSELDLEIVLARKGMSFLVKGQVVWVNDGEDPARRGMGIKFSDLTYEQKLNIYSLVDDSLRQRLLERRRFARIDAKLQVNFVYAEGAFELRSEDLSLGGMFIATDHLVPVGEKVRLVLHIPGGKPAVRTLAEVVRVVEESSPGQSAGLGVQFLHVDSVGQETIRNFLQERVVGKHATPDHDRRVSPRIERLVKLRFQATDAFGVSFTKDISSGGVFIHTHEPPRKGTRVAVTITHPVTLQRLELIGRVVRVVEPDPINPHKVPGVGIKFEQLTEDKKEFLYTFLMDFALLDNTQIVEKGNTEDQGQNKK